MPGKTQNIDEILNSIEGISRADAPEYLFSRLERKIRIPFSKGRTVQLKQVYMVAASLLLLVAVNVFLLSDQEKHERGPNDMHSVAVEYGLTDNI